MPQVHITLAGPGAMYIQWSTGAGKVEKNVNIAAYDVASVPSVVKYGTTSGKYDTTATGTGATFNQIYNSPTLDDFNYTSPIIHTVKISGAHKSSSDKTASFRLDMPVQ